MFTRRASAAFFGLLALAAAGRAETYELAENVQPGDCFQVQIDMKLAGELRVRKRGETVPLKLSASGTHAFPERVLAVGKDGLVEKAARVYETAKAVVSVEGVANEKTLRTGRRLIVAQRAKDEALVYSPAGPLTRDELELTSDHFDTLALTGLLPGKAVAVGDTWKTSNAVALALCNFEGLAEQTLTGKLEEVKDGVAVFSVTGTANGIDQGAQAKLTITATGRFDLKAKRLVALEWKQKDDRDQGPVSPASAVETTVNVRRTPVEQPAALSDVALVTVPADAPPPLMLQLEYRDPKSRFAFLYGREWRLTSQTDEHVVLRLMERGDFVAQATFSPWTPAEKGKHLSPEAFRDAMNAAPGWELDRELQAGEAPSAGDQYLYRLSLQGKMDGVDVLQNYYLLAAPGGEQLVVAVTLTPKQAEKLGARDLSLVGGVDLPAPPEKK
jgi:hypothetical protein